MMDRNPNLSMAELYRLLPQTFSTPTMSRHCNDERKYDVVADITATLESMKERGVTLPDRKLPPPCVLDQGRTRGCRQKPDLPVRRLEMFGGARRPFAPAAGNWPLQPDLLKTKRRL
jgi:hypothetical protein